MFLVAMAWDDYVANIGFGLAVSSAALLMVAQGVKGYNQDKAQTTVRLLQRAIPLLDTNHDGILSVPEWEKYYHDHNIRVPMNELHAYVNPVPTTLPPGVQYSDFEEFVLANAPSPRREVR